MTWTIPNTFIAGTKAKSGEVNENFTSLKLFVDTLETNQATNTTDILQLEENKADLNGSNEQRFQVADATNSFDAINKQTLLNLVSNTQEVIKGFVLSKFNNTTVSATAGSCYDSTFVYMIKSDTSLSKAQTNLGKNAKYYVYVCADKDNGNCKLVISLSNGTPELPAGFEYFRRLGYFTTNGSGNISQVLNNSDTASGYIAAKGYITLNGLVTIQWGYADVNLNNSSVDVNLPVTYKSAHLCCVCSPDNSWSNGDWDRICVGCQPVSLSKIRFTGGRSAAYRVYYISIGI
jgi:hypothetical protein